jgi:hypothetical protein
MGAVAFVFLGLTVRMMAFGTLESHFAQSTLIVFEASSPSADTRLTADALDKEIQHATQALEAVEDRAVFQRGRRALVLLRVRHTTDSAAHMASRVVTLLAPHVLTSAPVTWPLVPEHASLFRRFGAPEAKAKFESDAARTAEIWLATGDEGIAKERRLDVVPNSERLRQWGVDARVLTEALERGLSLRPPLPRVEKERVLPSAWERPSRTPSEVASRVLNLSVEKPDGSEVPLTELAGVTWRWVPQQLASPSVAPLPPKARDWLTHFAQQRFEEANAPWSSHWTREDFLLAGGLLVASACLGIVTMRTIAIPVDALFLVLFATTFTSFFVVSPLASDAAAPQGWLLASAALAWGCVRCLPWRLSRNARAGWSAAQILIFAGVFVALAFGFLKAPLDALATSVSHAGAQSPVSPGDETHYENETRVLKDGLKMGSSAGSHGSQIHFSRVVETDTGTVEVRLVDTAQSAVQGAAQGAVGMFGEVIANPTRLGALRNGAAASFFAKPSHLRSTESLQTSLLGWMTLTLAAAAFSAALLGGGFARWATLFSLQVLATLVAGAFAWTQSHLSVPPGLDVSAIRLDALVPWSVALSSVSLVWLDARTRQLQARQMDTLKASRIAGRQLLRTALSLLACATLLWPTVLLLDRFVSAAVLSAFWLACVFLFPCIVAMLSHKILEAIHYKSLARRVRKLSLRMAHKGTNV